MAGAECLGALLLLVIGIEFGIGLHLQIAERANDPLSKHNVFARRKREWVIPPVSIYEGRDNSNKNPIAKIQSDYTAVKRITYKITGSGVTEPPYGLFTINERTGELNVYGIVDRETTPMFYLKGFALDQDGNDVEPPIDLRVKVIDVNDNNPVFTQEIFHGSVEELSLAGTVVMRINATDADEENNLNSKIAYKILSQEPAQPQIFFMNKANGEVRTLISNLDREKQSSYTLTVEAKDMDGSQIGLAGTSTVRIEIIDVNDNIPVLEKEMYEGSVEENIVDVEILRMKVFDLDQEFTDNWLANFTIDSGNEDGYFRIDVDRVTNEGILMLVKEVDYEQIQDLNLNVIVSNKASYHSSVTTTGGGGGGGAGGGGGGGGGGSSTRKAVPIKVKVKNVSEGPVFKPKRKIFSVSESTKTTTKNQVIGTYPAYDGDTGKIADNVKYAKEFDADNWFRIDSKTAEITLVKIPDRESIYVVNGTYIAKVLAISEVLPGKTATGTIAIQVEDVNDNCPKVVNPVQTICENAEFVNITAEDQDAFPNGGPFTFTILDEPAGTASNWAIGRKDNISVQLVPNKLWPRSYDVPIRVADLQGVSCPEKQILKLTICTCGGSVACSERLSDHRVALGAGAVGLMILACLLLLLVPLLLLLCYCGAGAKGFTAIPETAVENLPQWNREGQPEDMAVLPAPIIRPVEGGHRPGNGGAFPTTGVGSGFKGFQYEGSREEITERWETGGLLQHEYRNGMMAGGGAGAAVGGIGKGLVGEGSFGEGSSRGRGFETIGNVGAAGALQEDFIRGYFIDKSLFYAEEDEARPSKDCLLIYSQEGMGSPPGSIGCCSFIDGDLDDNFLDDLGLKFKTLAEICLGQQIYTQMEESQYSSQGRNTSIPRAEADKGLALSGSSVETGTAQHTVSYDDFYSYGSNSAPETVTRHEVVSEESISARSNLHPTPMAHGNILVTETSYVTGPTTQNVHVLHEPRLQQNVIMTERVLTPSSNLHGMFDMHDMSDGQNVLVTERYINGDSGLVGLHEMPDSQYVVLRERERLLAPSSGLQDAISIPDLSDGQNVLVTERLLTPFPSLQGNGRMPSEVSSGHKVITGKTVVSGSGMQGHLLTSEPLHNRTGFIQEELPSSNHALDQSSSRVTKFSTLQYTRS